MMGSRSCNIFFMRTFGPGACGRRQARGLASFRSCDLEVSKAQPSQMKPKPPVKELVFGRHFTDHMMSVEWSAAAGWQRPIIRPVEPLQVHPGAKVLHYAQELFEGMKAYRGVDDQIRMFRPMHNMVRMNNTASRACLPNFDPEELLACIRQLIQIDQEWVPHSESSSLYIRPTLIGTEAQLGVASAHEALLFVLLSPTGPYFDTGAKPVSLLADPKYVRAFPGGCGFAKMGSNYAPTLWTQAIAAKFNCQQCLWLYGPDHEITEVGAMNIFVLLKQDDGQLELITPSLDEGVILPGVTRQSILELTRSWNEFKVSERKITMNEVLQSIQDGRLVEMFGSGTAAIVSPVGNIHYLGAMRPIPVDQSPDSVSKRILRDLSDIYYGRNPHPWCIPIENWSIDANERISIDEYRTCMETKLSS